MLAAASPNRRRAMLTSIPTLFSARPSSFNGSLHEVSAA